MLLFFLKKVIWNCGKNGIFFCSGFFWERGVYFKDFEIEDKDYFIRFRV